MDFYTIGSNGFAQFGDPDYNAKAKVEMNILKQYMYEHHPIPDMFSEFTWYRIKKFPYEQDYYHEIVLEFDDRELEHRSIAKPELMGLFLDWFFDIECTDLESEALTEEIEKAYHDSLNRDKAEHLRIIKKAS